MRQEQREIVDQLGDLDELINRVGVANNVYAQGNPQVRIALEKAGGLLMDLTAKITRLFTASEKRVYLFLAESEHDPKAIVNIFRSKVGLEILQFLILEMTEGLAPLLEFARK